MTMLARILWSTLVALMAAAHMFLPAVEIDAIALALIAIAALPWILPYVTGLEIPGVIKITLPETKAATEKLAREPIIVPAARLQFSGHAPTVRVAPAPDQFEYLRRVYETDPNLSLVAVRMEIEKKVVQLAHVAGVPTDRVGLTRIVRDLAKREIISTSAAAGLSELVALGNQAAHGAKVTKEAAEWVLDVAPTLLLQLEQLGPPEDGSNETES